MKNTSTSILLFECPSCGLDVHGRLEVEVELDKDASDLPEGQVVMVGAPIGVRVEHDCTRPTTR